MNIKYFKFVAILEGISYLILLGIGKPLKDFADIDIVVRMTGMPHGILFVLYVIMALILIKPQKWSLKDTAIILLCSLIPFGTFYVERKYLRGN